MGNHDLWNRPEDIAEARTAKKFQEDVKTLHLKLTAMPVDGRFTVAELACLLHMPEKRSEYATSAYTLENLGWLRILEKKVEAWVISQNRANER